MDIKATKYHLQNCLTNREFEDSGWMLSDPLSPNHSLVRTIYDKKRIELKDSSYGLYKFADWLPIKRALKNSSSPFTYKSKRLAEELQLKNLYITFSGYWPENGVFMNTCSFKETEAYSVCARLSEDNKKILVVASAGNTARAFAKVCSDNNIPIAIVIPEGNINAIWFKEKINDCVKIICTPEGSDYFDAISLASKLTTSEDFLDEGGAKNVARRDGMGTTVLSAATTIGRIPDVYFQAVGSGTGTIAAYEANLRLIEDGRFGNKLMKLIPSQNIPFTPMYDAYMNDSRELPYMSEDEGREKAHKIIAKVLSNRKPPYSIAGGLYDALKATNGSFEIATNEELVKACEKFEKLEGIDIYSAAGVALVSLEKAIKSNKVDKEEIIMLNITGGGEKRFKRDNNCINIKPSLIISPQEERQEVIRKVKELY